ncbi:YicC family protein [Bacillus sp. HMF5848]|uniref:YicC/YloC family endoribonuclease n=1 Tax=Bacillus sp. HMF5848 TaxID=2495421 RepID=UPI000F780F60|nr:YicC/YloC family endoribonuclease [Bacillus sp. HMF5848]RSK26972.1 YicC family protein [Bacillus sp. HMF5848]
MAISMTGYGRAHMHIGQIAVTVEIKTVNHRFCEIHVRMPRQFLIFEEKVKKIIQQYIKRGRVEIYITVEGQGLVKKALQVDWDLLQQYMDACDKISNTHAVHTNLSTLDLLTLEHVAEVVEREDVDEQFETILTQAVDKSCQQVIEMRKTEGQALKADLLKHIHYIHDLVSKVAEYAPNVINYYRERITKRVSEQLAQLVDEGRILTEVALMADKVDINEEITRIHSHLEQFRNTLAIDEPIGRKLDFLVQELNRETNTIGSKANDSKIATYVVEMKSALEKIKEQVQNVE